MSTTTSTGAAAATGQFQTVNGQIISPTGTVYTAKGINLYDSQMGSASQVLADFPGLNFVRLNVYSYQSPSAYAAFIQTMTQAGVVVELEDHTNSTGSNAGGGQGSAFTGQQLANESAWYASVASAYASNPYVWFGTNNEPPTAGLDTWEQATYNAIRGTGNTSPIMLELPGGGYPGNTESAYGLNPSIYSVMSNVIIDPHFYGWGANYSTSQSTVNAALNALVTGAQTIQTANGTAPVIIGEYGPSTDGQNTDANASQVLTAVQTSTAISGSVAWGWASGSNDNLTNGSGQLTSYGQEVAQWMASTGTVVTPPKVFTPSANDTVVKAASGAAITDAKGNVWTITAAGQVATNGVTDATTAGVAELAYVNGTIWQENTAGLWWGETTPNASWAPTAGTATSPLPVVVTPPVITPSANDTVVKLGSAAAITDASGNLWTVTAAGQVAVNGVADTATASVTELAYVGGTVWQENASNMWWGKTSPTAAWGPAAGTLTSPLPAAPVASANDTVVKLGSTAAITDATGNKWTVTSGGQVAVNGVADASTANVTELAYVNGTIWQENNGNVWWGKTSPTAAWAPGAGTATSPLPVTTSPNDTMVLAGSPAAIVDSSGNAWTINASGQVAVNGVADATTANVSELATVNGTVWQENSANLWWGKASPTAAWAPGAGTATSPLPSAITVASGTASATVSQSEVSVQVASGTHMLFVSGSGDVVSLAGGANTVTDTGSGNTYILPVAGKGTATFTSNITNLGDALDLKPALAATNWNGAAGTLANYVTVTDTAKGATVYVAATSGGAGVAIASITGATSLNYSTLMAHAIT